MKDVKKELPEIFTVGHSTRAIGDFISILKVHGVNLLVDVRTVPRSRYNPQFNKDTLPEPLEEAGVGYLHMPGLGGLRHALADSRNTGWKNASFRGYADYMQTPEFRKNIDELLDHAEKQRIAIMCAESVPWRCHRSLIADALTARGCPVRHIMGLNSIKPHELTSFAKVQGTDIIYPADKVQVEKVKLKNKRAKDAGQLELWQ